MKRLWILNDLFVSSNARSMGVGRRLMNRAKEHAQGEDALGLTLSTTTDNLVAQRLYESLGYERDTTFYQYNLRF